MELKPPKKCCGPNYDLTGSNRPKWGFADVAGRPLKFACLVKFIIPVNSTIASITKTIGIYVHLKNEKNTSSVIREKGCVSVCISGFYACAYQRIRNVRFLENLACFVFLKHPFWDSPFWLISDNLSVWIKLLDYLHQVQVDTFLESFKLNNLQGDQKLSSNLFTFRRNFNEAYG